MPRISVLIPFRDAEATLAAALTSVARQSEADWEAILVDDGSSDESAAMAARQAERDPRFRLLTRPRSGIVASLQAGLADCRAPLVARMDADDWMHRDRLALQADALDANAALDAVGCFVRIFPRQTLRDGRREYESWLNSLASPERIWRERFVECPVAHPALVVRRSRLVALGYRERRWAEDYDLLLRLLVRGPVVGMVPRRLLGWRDGPTRLSRTDPRCALERFNECRAWFLHEDFLMGKPRYVLWGYGATGRALRGALSALGHDPAAIVEVHAGRIGNTIHGAPVIGHEDLAKRSPYPIVVSVAGRGPRSAIRAALDEMGYAEGKDYVCAA